MRSSAPTTVSGPKSDPLAEHSGRKGRLRLARTRCSQPTPGSRCMYKGLASPNRVCGFDLSDRSYFPQSIMCHDSQNLSSAPYFPILDAKLDRCFAHCSRSLAWLAYE